MNKNIKGAIWAGVAAIAMVIAIVRIEAQRPKKPELKEEKIVTKTEAVVVEQTQIATTTPPIVGTSTATSTLPSKVIPRKPKKTSSKLSYTDAVAKYGFFRIQFSPGCLEAHPNQIAAANPVTLMLDNRSDKTQIFMIAGAIYSVNAYDYAVVTVNEKTLPMNIGISCNEQKNVAVIILQK